MSNSRPLSKIVTFLARLLLMLLALGGVGGLCFVMGVVKATTAITNRSQTNNNPSGQITNVAVEEVQPAELTDRVFLPGTTHSIREVRLSAEITARVVKMRRKADGAEVLLREGDFVREGDVLVELETDRLENQLIGAEAQYRLAEARYLRTLQLYQSKDKIATEDALDEARGSRDMAKAKLDGVKIELAKAKIVSPVTGFIRSLLVDEGECVNAGQQVVEVADLSKIEVRVPVPERDVPYLRAAREHGTGTPALVRFDFLGGKSYPTQVSEVVPVADARSKTYPVKLILDNPDFEIKPGMVAHVILIRRRVPNAITAPLDAVVNRESGHVVFVVEESGSSKDGPKSDLVAVERPVKLGVLDGLRIEVLEGLRPGDRLVVAGQRDLASGQRVKVVETVSTAHGGSAAAKISLQHEFLAGRAGDREVGVGR